MTSNIPQSDLSVTGLDFNTIKRNLKDFLRADERFKDFNFEGSGMSALLNILAYNTHYMGFYLNMAATEMFLDSAVDRNSVVSLAKHLGYTTQSRKAPRATVDIIVPNPTGLNPDGTFTIPAYTAFRSSYENQTYTFYNLDSLTAAVVNNRATFLNVELVEGTRLSFNYRVDSKDPYQRFEIPEKNVDLSTLKVLVQAGANSTEQSIYSPVSNYMDLSGTTLVYFLQESKSGRYEVYFGDGVLGRRLVDGEIVKLNYLKTVGPDANGVSGFSYSNWTVRLSDANYPASGGLNQENLDSIKFRAPLEYTAQNRALGVDDYRVKLLEEVPEIQFLSIWGGETLDPPQYGKVFISIKPYNYLTLSDARKSYILNTVLPKYKVVSITPELVDPDYTFIKVSSKVTYNATQTTKSDTDIKNLVELVIAAYNNTYMSTFDNEFEYSKFVAAIDDVDVTILSNLTSILMEKRVIPDVTTATVNAANQTVIVEFANPIKQVVESSIGTITSSKFVYLGLVSYLDDDGSGTMRVYTYESDGSRKYLNNSIGTVNYEEGVVTINNFNISEFDGNYMTVTAQPKTNNLSNTKNQILTIDTDDLDISISKGQ